MQASLASSDLVLLWVWRACLGLAALSLCIALGLAVIRWGEERARAAKRVRRARMERHVHALIASSVDISARTVPPLDPDDEGALFSVALDVLRVTRGRDHDRLLALLGVWNLRPFLERRLASGRRSRQIRALTLLSRFRDRESLDLLLRYVDHPAVYVQLAALRGIAERGETEYFPDVVRALSRARETNVPVLADILRRFGEEAVPALGSLAADRAARLGVRLAAAAALGRIGAVAAALDPLCELARDERAALRVRAQESLARLGDPRALPAVRAGLHDAEPRVRAAAADAAGLLGLRETLPALADGLGDPVWDVRYRAAESLYRLGQPGIAVLRAAAGGDGEVVEGGSVAEGATPAKEMAAELLAEKEGIPG